MTCRVEGNAPVPANGLFSTTAVLLTVGHLLPDEVVQHALDFVISCRNPSGNWFFDAALDIPDDADDTACALTALARFRPSATSQSDVDLLLSYWREPHGPFRTWHPASDERAEFWSFASTDDAIVNCNVLMALAELGVTPTRDMVRATQLLLATTASTRYYCGLSPIIHAAARVGLLSHVKEEIRFIQPDSSWTSLQLSNWLSARPDPEPTLVSNLTALQSDDGGWLDDDWCTGNIVPPTVWGSRAASTAFALEALVGMTPVTNLMESPNA